MALHMSKSRENDKPMTYLDEINLLRSKTGSEPAPVVEYSECKAQSANPQMQIWITHSIPMIMWMQ